MAYSYFKELVFLFSNILIFLFDVFYVMGILSSIVIFIYALSGSVLGRVVPFLRSHIDNKYVSHNVINIYYFDFLIGIFFNKMTLLPVL